ncbi:FAD-dependent monooxygenase [Ferriphaselus sp. R-1]|uniref:FAD-dependent monooxygenase n=1 Tax=Ferriphaselus sp. R-1 TaxID=1485544 RepID=UPI00055552E9|nr:FAD-dependent monooxygenase [Ferriphaselus sp. R-1]
MSEHYDIVIIGGGPVGSTLALALRDSGLRICLLEARDFSPSTDPRALALSYGTRLLLDRLGVWAKLPQVSGIRTIHISQKGRLGRTRLQAEELGAPELGYVLPYSALQNGLQSAVLAAARVEGAGAESAALSPNPSPVSGRGELICIGNAAVTALETGAEAATIRYSRDGVAQELTAKLAVVADGGRLLEASHPPEVHDYGQSGVIAHVTCAHPKPGTAFERFTPQGPVALLPYHDGYELVWTASHEQVQEMMAWDEATFLARLHEHFGDRVGAFTGVGPRSSYPLRLKRAPQTTLPHAVLLGNAAQTLHPVAGQGFNMGIRDAWELAQVVLRAAPESLGSAAMLDDYQRSRRLDRAAGIRFTDGLVRLFSNDLPGLGHARGASLALLDCIPPAKQFVAKRMMFGANG